MPFAGASVRYSDGFFYFFNTGAAVSECICSCHLKEYSRSSGSAGRAGGGQGLTPASWTVLTAFWDPAELPARRFGKKAHGEVKPCECDADASECDADTATLWRWQRALKLPCTPHPSIATHADQAIVNSTPVAIGRRCNPAWLGRRANKRAREEDLAPRCKYPHPAISNSWCRSACVSSSRMGAAGSGGQLCLNHTWVQRRTRGRETKERYLREN